MNHSKLETSPCVCGLLFLALVAFVGGTAGAQTPAEATLDTKEEENQIVSGVSTASSATSSPVSEELTVEQITGLGLLGLLEYAKKHNPLYLASQQQVRVAEGDLVTAGLLPNPVLSYQEQFIGGKRLSEGGETERAPGIAIDVDPFGRMFKRKELARRKILVTTYSFQDFDRLFRSAFRRAYYRHLFLSEQVQFKKQFFDSYRELVNAARIRAESGDLPKLEFDRLDLERLQYESEFKSAEVALKQSSRKVLTLLGLSYTSEKPLVFRRKLEFRSLVQLGIPMLKPSDHRPDLEHLREQAKEFEAQASLKAREAFPKLNLAGEYRFKGPEKYAGFFVTIPFPLFDRNQGEIAKAEASQQIYELKAQAKKIEIEGEVQAAVSELYEREGMLVEYQHRKMLEKNQSVADRSKRAYLQKAYSLVAFIESQRNYLNVLQNYYEQVLLYYLAADAYETAVYAATKPETT